MESNGRWVYRQADIHTCLVPSFVSSPGVKTGDVWECNTCHKQWTVTVNSDYREHWLTWQEKPKSSEESWRNPSWRD